MCKLLANNWSSLTSVYLCIQRIQSTERRDSTERFLPHHSDCSLPLHLDSIQVGRPHVALIRHVPGAQETASQSVAESCLSRAGRCHCAPGRLHTSVVCNGSSPRSIISTPAGHIFALQREGCWPDLGDLRISTKLSRLPHC